MTFLDVDSNCEDLDPGSPTEVITVKETPSVEYWENRSDNDYEEDIKNGIRADMKPGNMATNEEAKYLLGYGAKSISSSLSIFEAIMLMNKEEIRLAMEEDAARALRIFVALLARIVLFCQKLLKLALQNQLSLKHPFVKAALLVLWTSGDVEKHPGPPLNDIKTIRKLVPRLVREIQGKKVADWATMPSCWDRNVVPFQDINKMKNSDNEEKYALFYEALSTFMKMFCRVPDWCVEEMTYVETGNAQELHKCQTARKIRKLLEQHESSDREDILRRVGYQRQVGSVPGPAVNTSNGHQQRVQRFPCNVPGFLPISKITTPETARQIAKGCMAQSKNAGKCQPGNQQTKTNKRSATTTNVQPAAKQPRTLAARTSSPRATSTKVQPTTASTVILVANSRQSTPTASTVNQPRATTVITSSTSIATNPGPSLQTARNVTGQPSNPISTMSSVSAAPDTKPPNPDGQPSNLISLPSDDLDDLGFSSSVDLDQFINKILKDDKM